MTEGLKTLAGVVLQRYDATPRKVGDVLYQRAVDVRTGDKIIMAYCAKTPAKGAKVRIARHPADAGQVQPTWIVEP